MKTSLMTRAMEMAKQSDHRCQIGCIVTNKRGRVIASGYNQFKTHPLQVRYAKHNDRSEKIYLHAEISALIRCREEPHTVYIGRIMKNGKAGMCKPCPICEYAIRKAGVKVIIYTDSTGIEHKIKV